MIWDLPRAFERDGGDSGLGAVGSLPLSAPTGIGSEGFACSGAPAFLSACGLAGGAIGCIALGVDADGGGLGGGFGGVLLASFSRFERKLARGVIAGGDLELGSVPMAVSVASVADGVFSVMGTVMTSGLVVAGVTGLGPVWGDPCSFFIQVLGRVAWSFLPPGVVGLRLVGVVFFLVLVVMVLVGWHRSLRRN
jgi:hypothetical protein